jgi:hypothetical protein
VSQQQVFNPGDDGVSLPSLIEEVRASCTAAALAARIEGTIRCSLLDESPVVLRA